MTIAPLRKFETRYLGQLIRLSKIREYEPGEFIIKEGGQDTWIYFLLSGNVRVEKKGMEIAIIDRVGEIFGEMRLLDGLVRSASVYAEGKTVCLAFDPYGEDILSSPDQRTTFLLLLYKMFAEFLSGRLRVINDELSKIKKETGKK
jgi:CRP/FNR family cyclic AMP-dependent transcriptional regulator